MAERNSEGVVLFIMLIQGEISYTYLIPDGSQSNH